MTEAARRAIQLGLGLALLLAPVACVQAGAGGPDGSATPVVSPTPAASGRDGGSGEPGATGSGILLPESPSPTDIDQLGQAQLVTPRPGRLDVHAVGATRVEARLDGQHLFVQLYWWSGVAPCNVLDSVAVDRSGTAFHLSIREGSDQLGVACIEIAMLKTTIVDLGDLEPGTYTITAYGDAPPVQVTVP